MTNVRFLPPAAKYFKKLKDKELKNKFTDAIHLIQQDHTVGEEKRGDLTGIYGYDIFHNKTNYELAYRVAYEDGKMIIIIMAGTRENFYNELKRYLR